MKTLIRNGFVHDGRGESFKADILIEGGKIVEVGSDLNGGDASVIDANGLHVLPGFINAINLWGIYGPGWTGHDSHEASHPVTPQMDVTYAFDHDGMNFQEVWRYGVTAAGITPSPGNVLSGKAAVYKTYGRSPQKMLVKKEVAEIASISRAVKRTYGERNIMPMTKMGSMALLLEQLEKVRRADASDPDLSPETKAMLPVVNGTLPLFINCAGVAEIEAVLSALSPYPAMKLVLTGAYGINKEILATAGRDLGIILGDETEGLNPAVRQTDFPEVIRLMEEGAPFAIGCAGDNITMGKESLLWNAIRWHKHGLSADLCLRALTSYPAALLGVDDRIGSIQIGLDADLSVWEGNPIETYQARQKHIFISGVEAGQKGDHLSCW